MNLSGSGSGDPGIPFSISKDYKFTQAGTWTFRIFFDGTTFETATAIVAPNTIPTTFAFGNLSHTYDGNTKSATVTSTPSGAQYTSSLTSSSAAPGTYTVTATATAPYTGSASASLTIGKASQNISFGNPGSQVYGFPVTLSATATSGLPVTFSVVTGSATIAGSTVTATAQGNVTIRASQDGDTYFSAATSIDNTFLFANTAPVIRALTVTRPDGTAVGAGAQGEPAVYLGEAVLVTGTMHDDDGNLSVHTLSVSYALAPWTSLVDATPANRTDSVKSATFYPSASGRWDFNTNGTDGLIWPLGMSKTLWVYGQTNDSAVVGYSINGVANATSVSVAPGQTFPVLIKLRNTENRPWTTDVHPHKLVASLAGWGADAVALPVATVFQNAEVIFTFNVTAPSAAGTYTPQWQMAEYFNGSPTRFGAIISTTVVANRAPVVTMSASPASIAFGQSTTVSATATDADANLAFHGILARNQAGNDWYRSPTTDHSTGWGNHPTSTDFVSASYTSGAVSGGSSTRSVVHRPSWVGTLTYHSNANDSFGWANPDGYVNATVAKATPNGAFAARSLNPNTSATYTIVAGDLNAAFSNPYSAAVAAPTGTVTYSVVACPSYPAEVGRSLTAGSTLTAGAVYTVRASYPGDTNYNTTTVNAVWTVLKGTQSAVTSAGGSSTYGNTFTPTAATGGNGSGAYQWQLVAGGSASGAAINSTTGAITTTSIGTVSYHVRRLGDTKWNDSAWSANNTLNVTARAITLTLSGSKTYNGNTTSTGAAASLTTGPLASGDTIAYTYAATSSANVGSYTGLTIATVSNATAPTVRTGNYAITYLGSYTITKAPQATVSVSANPSSIYTSTSSTITASGGSGSGAWTITSTAGGTLTGSGATRTFTASTAGSYTVSATKAGDTNYNASLPKSTVIAVAADTIAPSVPTGLLASDVDSTSFTLNWTPSTDNVGVTDYEVYKDGALIGLSGGTTTKFVSGLALGSTYTMQVRARDGAGNWSALSAAALVETTPAIGDTDHDGMPDFWEQLYFQSTTGASPSADADGDGVSNLDEYNLWRNPKIPWDSRESYQLQTEVIVTVLAKGTGTVYVTAVDKNNQSAGGGGFAFLPRSGNPWAQSSGGSPARLWLVLGAEYTLQVTATGVTDYVVKASRVTRTSPLPGVTVELNGSFADTILKSEMNAGKCSLRAVPRRQVPFAQMDDSQLEDARIVNFGFGSSRSGQSPGLITYSGGSALQGSGFALSIFKGAALEWSQETPTHFQGRAPAGFVEVLRARAYSTVRYFSAGNYPEIAGFKDFSGATPLATYQIYHLENGSKITQSAGGVTMLYEDETEYSEVLTTANLPEDPNYSNDQPTEHYYAMTGTARYWRWRALGAPRQGRTKIVSQTLRTVLNQGNPKTEQTFYGQITVATTRFNGPAETDPVASHVYKTYAPEDYLLQRKTYESRGVPGDWARGNYTYTITPNVLSVPPASTVNSTGGGSYTEYFGEIPFSLSDVRGTSNLEGQPVIALGETKRVTNSFGDSSISAATNPVTTYSYFADPVDGIAVVSGTVSLKGTTQIGRTSYVYASGTFNGLPIITTTATGYSSAAASLATVNKSYSRRLANLDLRGQPVSGQRPDGTKTSYAYQRGTLASSGAWSVSATGPHLLTAVLSGKVGTSINQYNPVANNTTAGSNSVPVDSIDLDPSRSTVSQTIVDSDGRVLREASYVYAAGNTFNLLAATYNSYDLLGNLLLQTDQPNGAGRVLFEASYSGLRKTWERDASGVKLSYTYDDYGRVSTATREAVASVSALVTTYTYDITTGLVNGRGQIVRQTLSSPGETKILVSETATDTAGRVVKTTVPGGYVTTTAYNSSSSDYGLITTTTAPGGGTSTIGYFRDGRKHVVTGTAVPEITYSYAYGTDGNLTTTETVTGTNPTINQSSTTVTDWAGRVVSVTTPARNGSTPTTRVLTHRYNSKGQLKAQDSTSAGTKIVPTSVFTYDSFGRLQREATDTNNNDAIDLGSDAGVKEYEFDYRQTSFNRLDTDAATGTAWYRYEGVKIYPYDGANASAGRYFSQTYTQLSGLSAGWAAHSFGYDFDRNATESFASVDRAARQQIVTTLTTGTNQPIVQLSINGLVMESTDAQGHTTELAYDGLGRPVGANDPRIGLTSTAYINVSGTDQTTTLVASATAPDNKTTSFGYDAAGRRTRVTAPDLKVSSCQYDAMGNLTHAWGDTTNPVKYVYDELGRRTEMYTYRSGTWTGATLPASFSSATGDKTTWNYDATTGHLLFKADAADTPSTPRRTTYTYDPAGRMLTRTDARGVVTTYEYFGVSYASAGQFNGLQRAVTYSLGTSGAAATTNLAYTYYRSGKIKTVTDAAGVRTFNYFEGWTGDSDLRGHSARLQTEVLPSGYFGSRTLTYDYQYGVAGRRNGEAASVQYGAAADYRVTYGYDSVLRLNQVNGSAAPQPFDYTYTDGSNLIESVAQWVGAATNYRRVYDYEAHANRLENLQHSWGANAIEARFGYNNVGLRSSEATAGSSLMSALGRSSGLYTGFTYTARREVDTSGQANLTAAWGKGTAVAGTARDFNYDPIGNRTTDQSGSYGPNALNQYTTAPGVASLTYDFAGNLGADGSRTYTYDAENRLAAVTQGGVTSTFKYDYLGRRISKNVGGTETRFIYDGWNLIAEISPSTFAIQRTYTWGLDASGSLQGAGGVGGLLCIASGSNRYYPIYDGSFNVIGLYDGNGAIAAAYRYDPFGNILKSAGSAKTLPFGFSTKYTDRDYDTESDSNTGLVYYGLRYYHPKLGRFINRDPIEEQGGINLYAFCGNDGVNRYDLLGMEEKDLFHPKDPSGFADGTVWVNPDRDTVTIRLAPGQEYGSRAVYAAINSANGQTSIRTSDGRKLDGTVERDVQIGVGTDASEFGPNSTDIHPSGNGPAAVSTNRANTQSVNKAPVYAGFASLDAAGGVMALRAKRLTRADKDHLEYSGALFSYVKNGVTLYGYTTPLRGEQPEKVGNMTIWHGATISRQVPDGTFFLGGYHSHPNGNSFSNYTIAGKPGGDYWEISTASEGFGRPMTLYLGRDSGVGTGITVEVLVGNKTENGWTATPRLIGTYP